MQVFLKTTQIKLCKMLRHNKFNKFLFQLKTKCKKMFTKNLILITINYTQYIIQWEHEY